MRADTHRLYSERPDRLREDVVARLARQTGLDVLDVGCGPGGYHLSISSAGARVVGVDASAGMVSEARARAASGEYRVQLVQADAQALPFRDEAFDRVFAAHAVSRARPRSCAE